MQNKEKKQLEESKTSDDLPFPVGEGGKVFRFNEARDAWESICDVVKEISCELELYS